MGMVKEAEVVDKSSRIPTEMQLLNDLRKKGQENPAFFEPYMVDGKIDMLKLAQCSEAERPVHHRMTQEIFADLLSEGVSESTFSTHAAFATDLRKNTRPEIVAKMVFCNRNFALLFGTIKSKIIPAAPARTTASDGGDWT